MRLPYQEGEYKITYQGREFTAAGASLFKCNDGKIRGHLYVNEKNREITNRHGRAIAPAQLMYFNGAFSKMCRVSFDLKIENKSVKFVGDFNPDNGNLVKVRSTKKVNRYG